MKTTCLPILILMAVLLSFQCSVASCLSPFNVTGYQAGHSYEPRIFFDKSMYFPPVKVFWDQSASLISIGIVVEDSYRSCESVKIWIFSSIDADKVTLKRVGTGRFEGAIIAKCLRAKETLLDPAVFNVKYGDTITAQYASQTKATAFISFPRYVLDNFCGDPSQWQLFDNQGIPMIDYGPPIGVQYNPVETCHYALANYYMYLMTGDPGFREKFFVQANWLVLKAELRDGFRVWEYRFDWPVYNCTGPWVSAMAQGEGLSVLTRAYALSGNATYLGIAQAVVRSFEYEMISGGVRNTDSDGVWYEEYADAGAQSGKVLNGFIFSLFGLFEYSFETGDIEAHELFWEGANSLSLNLYRYDTGSWSRYDLLHETPAPLQYHTLHINQLWTMHKLTGDYTFQEYSQRFISYLYLK